MVVSASELLFCLVLGGIGAIIVLVLTVVVGYLFKLVCRFFSWIASNFKKKNEKIALDSIGLMCYIFSCTIIQEIYLCKIRT